MNKPTIIQGGIYSDKRGILRFVNDFLMKDVVRFYIMRHINTNFIRAWQAHKTEKKYFYVLRGKFVVAYVKIDNFTKPDLNKKADYTILSDQESKILSISKGYANGIKALDPDSEILVFSNLTVENSKKDDYRFPSEWWFDWNKMERR